MFCLASLLFLYHSWMVLTCAIFFHRQTWKLWLKLNRPVHIFIVQHLIFCFRLSLSCIRSIICIHRSFSLFLHMFCANFCIFFSQSLKFRCVYFFLFFFQFVFHQSVYNNYIYIYQMHHSSFFFSLYCIHIPYC